MALVLPPDLTSRLTAVNTLLLSIGESPVNSVETSEAVDVASANASINEVSLAVQQEGWHWNRETSYSMTPTVDNTIQLPANCLFIAEAYWEGGSQAPVVERARQLYNTEDHSYTFTDPVVVDMILNLAWEEMPEYARRYITIRAAQLFQGRLQSSTVVFRVQDSEVEAARAVLEAREDEANPRNSITGNRQQFSRVYGRNMRRRY